MYCGTFANLCADFVKKKKKGNNKKKGRSSKLQQREILVADNRKDVNVTAKWLFYYMSFWKYCQLFIYSYSISHANYLYRFSF